MLFLLGVIIVMFFEALSPHLIEFCLLAWQALSAQIAYRLMFLGFIVLILSALTFLMGLWWHARVTEKHVQQLLLSKRNLSTPLVHAAEQLGLASRLDLVATPQPFALCYGWLRPRVLLTTGLIETLDEQELDSVLAHERYHLLQRDPLKILVARALSDAVFFFPLLRDLVDNYLLLQEIAADQHALAQGATRATLASALVKVVQTPTWDVLALGAYSPFGERVQHLAQPQRKFNWRISWLRGAVSGVAVALLLLAVLHPTVPMAFGEALHADCHHSAVLDIHAVSASNVAET